MKTTTSFDIRSFRESAAVRGAIVGAAVMAIADFGFSAQELTNAQSCTVSILQAPVNFLCTGHDPNALLGIPLAIGDTAIITGNVDVNNLRLVSQTGANAHATVILEWNLVP